MFRLQGAKVWLVPFGERHLVDPAYFSWLTDYDVIKTINRADYLRPIGFDEVRKYCESVMDSETDLFWAIHSVEDDRFLGTVRVSSLNWRSRTAELGILVGDRTVWGKGVGSEALGLVGAYLFKRLGLRRLTAGLMSVNVGMLKVFLKLGFRQEGVLRQQDRFEDGYCDHIYVGCLRDEFRFQAELLNPESIGRDAL